MLELLPAGTVFFIGSLMGAFITIISYATYKEISR